MHSASRRIHTSPTWSKKLKIPDPNVIKNPHIPTPKERELMFKRRVEKAERDERVDISMSLTEVKTYQGGFTQPRMLRASNWFPGGTYIAKNKVYEKPLDSAYEPHTVYILESRYPVKTKEQGRPDVPEHIVDVIHEPFWLRYLKYKNSPKVGGHVRLTMDAAWWPFIARRIRKAEPEQWWEKDEDPQQLRLEALGLTESDDPPEPLRAYYKDITQYRPNGTKIVEPTPTKTIVPQRKELTIGDIRAQYEPLLEKEAFWRPLVAVTLATRPLANTLVRLCRSLPRGLPFYSSIDTHDRKNLLSFPDRMRLLRLQRMRELTLEIARRLEGYNGGFIGIRFNKDDRGRAIGGERLEKPLPDPLRVIQVGLGDWYELEKEMELWKLEAADAGVDIDVKPMDEWGRKLDENGTVLPGQDLQKGDEYRPEEQEVFDNQGEDDTVDDEEDGHEDEPTDRERQKPPKAGSSGKSEQSAPTPTAQKVALGRV
ncbi:hypothetical protein RSOLAG1IB_06108 [Rhizoctonia solani AG-1 IB]|uniref:Uncharacterized protein n=1 Tax=Thanatephorus cucumeris (strain AG1-IB / isolate 7/3/14) TaxID=1108050 RepID=A0A0B7F672_THACB|nr:hypothetical protein RSOLAG1IB_06108 [Rhizoctonia solani AG-1 IB]